VTDADSRTLDPGSHCSPGAPLAAHSVTSSAICDVYISRVGDRR